MADPEDRGLNVAGAREKRGNASRLIGFLTSGEEFLGGVSGGKLSYKPLPKPARFLADMLLSPVGLASLAFAPLTGGSTLGLRGAAAVGAKAATRVGAEAAVGTAATLAGREVSERIPEDAPGVIQCGAPILAGLATGVGTAGLLTAGKRSAAAAARAQYDTALTATAAASGRKFAADIGDFDNYLTEVQSGVVDNGVLRALSDNFGIDPANAATDPIAQALIAKIRMDDTIDSLVTSTMSVGLPRLMDDFKFDKEGLIRGTGLHWN